MGNDIGKNIAPLSGESSKRPAMLQGTSSTTKIERSPWSRICKRLKEIGYLPKDFKE